MFVSASSSGQSTTCRPLLADQRDPPRADGSVERLYLQHGENYLNLSAFDDVLRDISCSSDVTPSTLLKAKPFTLSYVNNIIVSVEM